MYNIGILGFGTVGEGIKEILDARREEIYDLTGKNVNIKKKNNKSKHKKSNGKKYRQGQKYRQESINYKC